MENVSRKIIKHKVGLLNLAKELGNVFQAYRAISITSSGEIFIRRKLQNKIDRFSKGTNENLLNLIFF